MVGLYFVPFLFMGLLEDYLCLDLWSASAAVHSRDVSVGSHQTGPGQHQPACSDESNQTLHPTAAAPPPSLGPSQPARPVLLLQDLTLAGSCGLHSSSNRTLFLSLLLSFISLCALSIYLSPSNKASCACCSALTHQPPNHKARPQWIRWQCASQPALSGERG